MADRDVQDRDGKTALMRAAEERGIEHVQLLIDADVDIQTSDSYSRTALERAERRGIAEMVKLLRDAGATE